MLNNFQAQEIIKLFLEKSKVPEQIYKFGGQPMVIDGMEHFGYKIFDANDASIAGLDYIRAGKNELKSLSVSEKGLEENEAEQIGMITLYIGNGKYVCDDFEIAKTLLNFINE